VVTVRQWIGLKGILRKLRKSPEIGMKRIKKRKGNTEGCIIKMGKTQYSITRTYSTRDIEDYDYFDCCPICKSPIVIFFFLDGHTDFYKDEHVGTFLHRWKNGCDIEIISEDE